MEIRRYFFPVLILSIKILRLLDILPTRTVDVFYMHWVINRKTTGLGVWGNAHQVFGNVPNTWEMLHCQDISIYFCINISIEYMMLEKLCIALMPHLLISKMRIASLPSIFIKAVRDHENRIRLRSQDACVLVLARTTNNWVTLGKSFLWPTPEFPHL